MTPQLAAGLALVLAVQADTAAAASGLAGSFGSLWAFAGAFATSAALAFVKTFDTTLTSSALFRKLQPVITLAGAWLLGQVGATVDPVALTTAPLATVAAVTVAELLGWLKEKWGGA